MAYEKQFWDESYNDCQECKRLDQAMSKLRTENDRLKARVDTLSDSCLGYSHSNKGLLAEIERLKKEIDRLKK